MTNETADQIRNKRKTFGVANVEGGLQEGALETEGGCDLIEPSVAFASQEISDSNEGMLHEWKQGLVNEIEKQTEVPSVLREIYTRLNELWAEGKTDLKILTNSIENFIKTSLYRALKNKSEKVKSQHNKKSK